MSSFRLFKLFGATSALQLASCIKNRVSANLPEPLCHISTVGKREKTSGLVYLILDFDNDNQRYVDIHRKYCEYVLLATVFAIAYRLEVDDPGAPGRLKMLLSFLRNNGEIETLDDLKRDFHTIPGAVWDRFLLEEDPNPPITLQIHDAAFKIHRYVWMWARKSCDETDDY